MRAQMTWMTFACAMALGCGGGGSGDDTIPDAGPEDAGPLPSKCSTVAGPITISTRAATWAEEDGDAVWPAIVTAGGSVWVAWYTEAHREVEPTATEHVWVAELDTTGNRQGDIAEAGAGGRAPSLAVSGDVVAIAWREVGVDLNDVNVALLGSGPTLTAAAEIGNAEPQTTPSITGTANGDGFGVALTVDPSDLAFVRLDAAGMPSVADPEPIVEATIFAKPSAVATPDGFMVVFGLASGFRAALLDGTGVLLGDPHVVADANDVPCDEGICKEYLSTMPAILGGDRVYHFNDDGDLLNSTDHAFFGRGIGYDGSQMTPTRTILVADSPARNPAAAWTGDGVAVVWADGREPDSKLRGALLDANLESLGGATDVALQRGDEEMPAMVWLGTEGMVAYSAGEEPARVIKVQRISCTP